MGTEKGARKCKRGRDEGQQYAHLLMQRIYQWFHNSTRQSNATTKSAVIPVKRTTKLPAAWQAYSTLFYQSKLKPLVDNAWEAYKAQVKKESDDSPTESVGDTESHDGTSNGGENKRKTRLLIQNEVVQAEYRKETPEVRAQVEAYRKNLKQDKPKSPEVEGAPDNAKLEEYRR